jgi:hypothetical protein
MRTRQYVFSRLPTFCDGMKPAILIVRCPGHNGRPCGRPHPEYFGPRNRDEAAARVRFLERELARAYAILATGKRRRDA